MLLALSNIVGSTYMGMTRDQKSVKAKGRRLWTEGRM